MQRTHSVTSRLTLAALILILAGVFEIIRRFLRGGESPGMAAWSGQVIFGFYFAILVLAIQRLQALSEGTRGTSPKQRLFLLVLICLCSDLVLVNYQEAVTSKDASYGLVVLWDVATFFVWLRAIDLCRRRSEGRFLASWIIGVAPLLKLGREILFIPYGLFFIPTPCNPDPDVVSPYLDLAFGDLLVCLWIFIPLTVFGGFRRGRLCAVVVFTGCVYWVLRAVDDLVTLVLCRTFVPARIPPFFLPCLYIMIATGVTVIVWQWDLLRIGTFFGIKRSGGSAT